MDTAFGSKSQITKPKSQSGVTPDYGDCTAQDNYLFIIHAIRVSSLRSVETLRFA